MTTEMSGADITALYHERAQVLSLLSLHYPCHLSYSDPQFPEYPVLIMETPHGQLSWHIAPPDVELFDHVRRATAEAGAAAYDGHSTAEKHERIQRRVRSFPVVMG